MANLTLPAQNAATFDPNVYQIETSDPVLGHDGSQINIANLQARRLAENDLFLKEKTERLADGSALAANSITRDKISRGVLPVGVPRNTVVTGPYTAGARTLLTSSGSNLLYNPFRVAFAGGWDAKGPVDYFGQFTVQGTVGEVATNNATHYIYAALAANGTLSVAGTTRAPSYGLTAPVSPQNRDFWYDMAAETMYQYNSGTAAWEPVLAVFIGQAIKLIGGSWSAITTYEYRRDTNLEGVVAAGTIAPYAGANVPSGWLLCDGVERNIAQYPRLYAAIGTTYGGDTGAGYFQTPDLRGRTVVGKDDMGGTAANRVHNSAGGSGINGAALGAAGGAQAVQLTIENIPPHTHPLGSRNDRNTLAGGDDEIASRDEVNDSYSTGSTGGAGGAATVHQNMQPSLITNYIIKC